MIRNLLHILLVVWLLAACSQKQEHFNTPNILIVLTDDQGYGDVGYNGNEMIRTPMLDSLATQSVVFDKFYVSPVCAPTRASILTGKYHLATGTSWVTHRKEVMRESEITLAEILKGNGYETGYFGKWHNGAQFPHNPLGQGFDTFFGFCAGHWNNYFDTELTFNNETVRTTGYITDVLTDSVNSFIGNTSTPFFAMVAYNTPHTPYQVSDKYYNHYKQLGLDSKTSSIYGMCENIDDNFARIYNQLKLTGKYENTIIIFLSDNGPNYVRYNSGLKGRKGQVDEGGVRVPFVFHYPKAQLSARVIKETFGCHIDMVPTLLEFCGMNPKDYAFDGVSLKETICSKHEPIERNFYSHHVISDKLAATSVRNGEYLLTMLPSDTALYNLHDDPNQKKNIYNEKLLIAHSLRDDYTEWYSQVTVKGLEPEPIYVGANDYAVIELPAHEAKLYGDLNFYGGMGWANDWVLGFNHPADSMVWKIKVMDNCRYKATLRYACSEIDTKHVIRLAGDDKIILKPIVGAIDAKVLSNRDRVKRSEVEQRSWGELKLGTMEFDIHNEQITLSINSMGYSNIEIKELILTTVN